MATTSVTADRKSAARRAAPHPAIFLLLLSFMSLVHSSTQLSLDSSQALLHRALEKELGFSGNVVYSPYAILVCMAAVTPAASGQTRESLEKFFDGAPPKEVLKSLDVQWMKKLTTKYATFREFTNLYVADTEERQQKLASRAGVFGEIEKLTGNPPHVTQFNQETLKSINKLIADTTNNKIKDAINFLPISGVLLVSAIYLKAYWTVDFNDYGDHPFKALRKGKETEVSGVSYYSGLVRKDQRKRVRYYLHNVARYVDNAGMFDVSVLQIPLYAESGDLKFVFYWPSNPEDLPELNALRGKYPDMLRRMVESESNEKPNKGVRLVLPQFRAATSVTLVECLGEEGVILDELEALGGVPLINSIAHKAIIEVNKHGVEAAAVSWSDVPEGIIRTSFEVTVQSAFMFQIVASGRVVLFEGVINDPTQ